MAPLTEEQRARVEQSVPLAKWAVKRFRTLTDTLLSNGWEREDVEQLAIFGVMRAAAAYDPARGMFSTYAVAAIRGTLMKEIDRGVARAAREGKTYLGLDDTERVADHPTEHDNIPARSRVAPPLARTRDRRYSDLRGPGPAHRVRDERRAGLPGALPPLSKQVEAMLGILSDRERAIVTARFGLHADGKTLAEVSVDLGVSKERVKQIEKRALDKLRSLYGAEFDE